MNETPILNEADEQDDSVGDVLAALGHLAVIADDLYSAIGDDESHLDADDQNAILNAYEILSGIYDRLDDHYDYASSGYDDEEVDSIASESAVFESTTWKAIITRLASMGFQPVPTVLENAGVQHLFMKEGSPVIFEINSEVEIGPFRVKTESAEYVAAKISTALARLKSVTHPAEVVAEETVIDEAAATVISEGETWTKLVKMLSDVGLKAAKPGVDYGDAKKLAHVFGIPMRAGKWADTWFTISLDDTAPYTVVINGKSTTYDKLSDAVTAIKKASGNIKESINWNIIEDLGDNEIVERLRRVRDQGYFGLAEDAKIEAILAETVEYDADLTQAIVDFREHYAALTEGNEPKITAKGLEIVFSSESEDWKEMVADWKKQGITATTKGGLYTITGPFKAVRKEVLANFEGAGGEKEAEKAYPQIKIVKEDAEQAKADSQLAREPVTEDDDIQEATPTKQSIQTWNLAKGMMDPYRLEVIGQDGSDVARIIDKVLPGNKANAYDDQLGFKSTAEREKAAKALVDFYKNLKEEDSVIIPLGDISEAIDEDKFRKLAQTGLVDKDQVSKVVKAMKDLEGGKTLNPDQKNIITSTFQNLVGLVTGDSTVFAKIQGAIKKGPTE